MGWHRLERKLSARELDAEFRRLTAVVREGKATPEELGSGTFTLNNVGAAPTCRSPREAGSAALLLPDGPIPRLRRDRFHFKGGF
jgi:pyruvate/2-oxoglutarate dehydrogenase complex dihydrolipoamide acyltransferase (E2) component